MLFLGISSDRLPWQFAFLRLASKQDAPTDVCGYNSRTGFMLESLKFEVELLSICSESLLWVLTVQMQNHPGKQKIDKLDSPMEWKWLEKGDWIEPYLRCTEFKVVSGRMLWATFTTWGERKSIIQFFSSLKNEALGKEMFLLEQIKPGTPATDHGLFKQQPPATVWNWIP